MSEAEKILKLIETVDPADTVKLDDIDCHVAMFLNGEILSKYIGNDDFCSHYSGRSAIPVSIIPQYTRSRDALKAIRPKGWNYECNGICDGTRWAALHVPIDEDDDFTVEAWYRPTEELAELHAIIQAIAYERGQK